MQGQRAQAADGCTVNLRELRKFNAHANHCAQCAGAALDEPIGTYCTTGQSLLDKAWEQLQKPKNVSVTPNGTVTVKVTRGDEL